MYLMVLSLLCFIFSKYRLALNILVVVLANHGYNYSPVLKAVKLLSKEVTL